MPFTFDPEQQRYRTLDGRLVREQAVRSALDRVIDSQSEYLRTLTQSLVEGGISLATWQLQTMQAIKSVHLVGLAVAHGGWNQLEQSDFGWAGQRIRTQYGFLTRFTLEITSGAQKLDGTAVARAALYAQAGRTTHREAERRHARIAGELAEERRILGIADHCKDCLEESRKGWQPLGTLRAIGDSACRVNCRCHFDFRFRPAA